MGTGTPKQFLEVEGKPIIIHTLSIFDEHPAVDGIYVACKEDYIPKLKRYIDHFMIEKVKRVVPGGATGQDSIYNALRAAAEDNPMDSIVMIHDGVRPCILPETIDDNLESVRKYGNAVTCTPFYETPVISNDGILVDSLPPRNQFFTAQAPQSFRLGDVMAAHKEIRAENPGYEGIVDTCTLMRKLGKDIHIVSGPRSNIKVTTPEDLYSVRALLQYAEAASIFGFRSAEVPNRLKK